MPWWAWLLTVVVVVALASGLLFRSQIRFVMKVTKAVATDRRLPRPWRWAIAIATRECGSRPLREVWTP
jgi:hypothetical protein